MRRDWSIYTYLFYDMPHDRKSRALAPPLLFFLCVRLDMARYFAKCWPPNITLENTERELSDFCQSLRDQVEVCAHKIALQQTQLRAYVTRGTAPSHVIKAAAHKIQVCIPDFYAVVASPDGCTQILQREHRTLQSKLDNAEREQRQLVDVQSNRQMATIMQKSVEAQRRVWKYDNMSMGAMDDMLDDVQDRRDDMREMSERLAEGGIDDYSDALCPEV